MLPISAPQSITAPQGTQDAASQQMLAQIQILTNQALMASANASSMSGGIYKALPWATSSADAVKRSYAFVSQAMGLLAQAQQPGGIWESGTPYQVDLSAAQDAINTASHASTSASATSGGSTVTSAKVLDTVNTATMPLQKIGNFIIDTATTAADPCSKAGMWAWILCNPGTAALIGLGGVTLGLLVYSKTIGKLPFLRANPRRSTRRSNKSKSRYYVQGRAY